MISKIVRQVLIISVCFGSWGTAAEAGAIAYVYDQLGRLKRVTYPSGAVIEYSYDANGNRTAYTVTGSTNPVPASPTLVGQGMTVPTTTVRTTPTNAPQQ
ncbi:MAG TPA: RHS repeat domain-containing protein [Allosphingosinicella sp.]|jgi:YD repeat-containing protein